MWLDPDIQPIGIDILEHTRYDFEGAGDTARGVAGVSPEKGGHAAMWLL